MANEKWLIDANKLKNSIQLSIASWGRDCNSNAPVIVWTYKEVLSRLENSPTVDAVEVVHGWWMFHMDDAGDWWDKCSVCGMRLPNHDGSCCGHHYCPNCGAKMDAGENGYVSG